MPIELFGSVKSADLILAREIHNFPVPGRAGSILDLLASAEKIDQNTLPTSRTNTVLPMSGSARHTVGRARIVLDRRET